MTTGQLIIVTLRARTGDPHEVEGFVPYPNCPLAITPAYVHDSHTGWKRQKRGWNITHRHSGFNLGHVVVENKELAEQLLMAANPSFFGWMLATGYHDDPATGACRVWFRAACAMAGVECPGSVAA